MDHSCFETRPADTLTGMIAVHGHHEAQSEPRRVEPTTEVLALMADADFADCYRINVEDPTLDASGAVERMLGRFPQWVDVLMRFRNLMVGPLGLKTGIHRNPAAQRWIGSFPVLSETSQRVVLGFDDRHLRFLLVIDVDPPTALRRLVAATTLVRTHNRFGRLYLVAVMPFHRRIGPHCCDKHGSRRRLQGKQDRGDATTQGTFKTATGRRHRISNQRH
jgi:hypothetical protein